MNKKEVEVFVKEKKEGTVYDSYGPSLLNDLEVWEVWEVWVQSAGEFAVRFVATGSDESVYYFSEFQQLSAFLDRRHQSLKTDIKKLEEQLSTKKHEHHQNLVRVYVAAVVFLLSFSVLFYLIYNGIQPNMASFTVLGGLIASGGTMFFGAWKQAKLGK